MAFHPIARRGRRPEPPARHNSPGRLAWAIGLLWCVGCATTSGPTSPPRARLVAGIYTGQPLNGGGVMWTLGQADTVITGTGTFTPPGADSATTTYVIRGIMRYDQLTVRLVGAPGDTVSDSLVFRASFDAELYTAVVFDGTITGGTGSPLAGNLQIIRQDSTSQ